MDKFSIFNVSLFQDLVAQEIPKFVVKLNQAVYQDKTEITNLSATTSAVVNILSNIANVSTAVNETVMQVRKQNKE